VELVLRIEKAMHSTTSCARRRRLPDDSYGTQRTQAVELASNILNQNCKRWRSSDRQLSSASSARSGNALGRTRRHSAARGTVPIGTAQEYRAARRGMRRLQQLVVGSEHGRSAPAQENLARVEVLDLDKGGRSAADLTRSCSVCWQGRPLDAELPTRIRCLDSDGIVPRIELRNRLDDADSILPSRAAAAMLTICWSMRVKHSCASEPSRLRALKTGCRSARGIQWLRKQPRRFGCLQVIDSGPDPAATLPRIFDPVLHHEIMGRGLGSPLCWHSARTPPSPSKLGWGHRRLRSLASSAKPFRRPISPATPPGRRRPRAVGG